MYNDDNTPYLSCRDRVMRAFALLDTFRLLTNDVPADAAYLYCRNTGAFPVWSFGDIVTCTSPEGDNSSIGVCPDLGSSDQILEIPKCIKSMAREYLVTNWVKRAISILRMLGCCDRDCSWWNRRGVTAFPVPWKRTIASVFIPSARAESISHVRNAITTLHSSIVQSILAGEMNRFIKDNSSWTPLENVQQYRLSDLMWIVSDAIRAAGAKNEIPDPGQMELICKAIEVLIMLKGCVDRRWSENYYTYLCYNEAKRESTTWLIDRCNGGRGPDGVDRSTGCKCLCEDRCMRDGTIDGAMYYLAHLTPAAAICIGNIFKPGWVGQTVYNDNVLINLARRINKRPESCIGIYFQYESNIQLTKMKFFEDRFAKKRALCSDECCESPSAY